MERSPDSQGTSDRPEWCSIRYSPIFHPLRGFELEFQWMATTVILLKKLVSESYDSIVIQPLSNNVYIYVFMCIMLYI